MTENRATYTDGNAAHAREREELPVAVRTLVDAASPEALRELERALRLRLAPAMTAIDKRLSLLGPLRDMIAVREEIQDVEGDIRVHQLVERNTYDEQRPPNAASGAQLVRLFGTWPTACAAAAGLLADGRWLGERVPWASAIPDKQRPPAYTRDEVIAALGACARWCGCRPTSNTYYQWAARRRAEARRVRAPSPRLPAQSSVERHFRSWAAALGAAAINDAELGTPGTDEGLTAGGTRDVGPELVRLDGRAIRRLRRQRHVSDAALRLALDMTPSNWRRSLKGRSPLSVMQVTRLAGLLGVSTNDLLMESPSLGYPSSAN
jgi:hypothetical protein